VSYEMLNDAKRDRGFETFGLRDQTFRSPTNDEKNVLDCFVFYVSIKKVPEGVAKRRFLVCDGHKLLKNEI